MRAKIFQKGAFKLESGKTGAGQAPGWGDTVSVLGANDALPYNALGKAKTVNSVKDNSITAQGFSELPRKVSNYVEQPLSLNNRYDGLNHLLYWALGLEDNVQAVVCYVCNTVATDPVPGDTYTDAQSHVCTFLRKEVNRATTYYIFAQSVVPTLTTGDLTRTSGAGDNTITFTARSPLMYEHVFKFDPRSRHNVAIPTDEQLSFYDSGDIKCRTAIIGVNMDPGVDIVSTNAMCKKIAFASSAGEIATIETDFLAYNQTVLDAAAETWTYPDTLRDSDNLIMHHDFLVQLGTTVSSLTTVGVTSFNIDTEIPLQVLQDTVSGQYIVEPVMEGQYIFDMALVLSRYTATTWQELTDAWTQVVARVAATQGYYLQEFLINNAIINSPGPDEDAVSKENVKLIISDSTVDNWEDYLYGLDMDHGPVTLRVRNLTVNNQMNI